MELVVLVLFVIGWLLLLFGAFGSGLELHLGHLTTIETCRAPSSRNRSP